MIPDFIPVLGYLDDVILVPLGIAAALRMLPLAVLQDCTVKAEDRINDGKPKNWIAGSLIILVWIAVFVWLSLTVYRYFGG